MCLFKAGILSHDPHVVLKCVFVVVGLAFIFPFLSSVAQTPLLLSDSRLHLFLQSNLTVSKIEACAQGKTRYTVAEAIQRSSCGYLSRLEDKASCDSDSER